MTALSVERPVLSARLDARLIIAVAVLVGLTLSFWLSSRYPALNEKALMGGDTPMSGLAFDVVFDIMPDSPVWWEFVANTANWIMTNLKGMAFGLLFGAGILTLLSLITKRSFKNGFANAALGTAIGAPLGVCVNCAAPIALGLHQGRMRLETTLSALLASPTLNVIVVTMSFAMLPLHMATIKLVLALAMVLLVVPIVCRFLLTSEAAESGENLAQFTQMPEAKGITAWIGRALAPQEAGEKVTSPGAALLWYIRTYARNLGFISLITVPMMLMAAVLGALVAIGFDSQELAHILPVKGAIIILAAMLVVAAIASFVPAPIALDVILTTVLIGVGLRNDYATAILIGLGSFSVYAFIILWRSISLRTAIVMWGSVIAMAMVGGVLSNRLGEVERQYLGRYYVEYLASAEPVSPPKLAILPEGQTATQLAERVIKNRIVLRPMDAEVTSDRGSSVEISYSPDVSNRAASSATAATDTPNFTRLNGQQIGLDERGMLTPAREFGVDFIPGGIVAGDLNNDGWIDVVVPRPTGGLGLSLYLNLAGEFSRQSINLGRLAELEVLSTALVDLNNDNWLDLVVSTRREGLFVLYNEDGDFDIARSIHLDDIAPAIAIGLGFADLDSDGRVDIVSGNWTGGAMNETFVAVVPEITANTVFWNRADKSFEAETLPGLPGQTLTVLVSDFNSDGKLDVFKGDDGMRSDQVVYFDGQGNPQIPDRDSQPFPYSMQSTMSMDSGDWNNDLLDDYYGGQITDQHMQRIIATSGKGRMFELCTRLAEDNDWNDSEVRQCAARMKSIDSIRDEGGGFLKYQCADGIRAEDKTYCMVRRYITHLELQAFLTKSISQQDAYEECSRNLARMTFALEFCEMLNYKMWYKPSGKERDDMPVLRNMNMLMTGLPDGSFADRASEIGAQRPGWTWNSRFTDLDQDGWQDLLVMTGFWSSPTMGDSNKFYRNESGKFTDATASYGFTDIQPSYSFASFDYDRDGDIDVIRPPEGLNMIVHRNDRPVGPALWVNLRDQQGNSMGIGSRVTICADGQIKVEKGRCFMRTIKASGGFMSFDPIAAHFGLGSARTVSLIQVEWPDKEVTRLQPKDLQSGEVTIARR